jgi:ribosomal protein S18 acetylase RimI-like enzyme|tara:strand:+ start:214 stop:603 length:390 start_codon:yes stop_codon:yes gene_type:complete
MGNIIIDFCNKEYWEFVRILRNDERVLDGFIESTHITEEMQENYMNNHSQYYRIALIGGKPAGYVGVIEDDIRVCTHPDFQGKGVGKFMINQCVEIWPESFAKVKINNEASIKLFEACGFNKKYIIFKK